MQHKLNYRGYSITITQDPDPFNPRTEGDNLGTIYGPWGEESFSAIVNDNWEDTKDYLNKHYIWLPVYGYIHGGKTVSTTPFNCPWDSGLMGVIAVSKKKAREEYGRLTKKTVAKIERYLQSEVENFDDCLTGNVWGYQVDKGEEHIASCWGYYGDWDNSEYGPLSEAKSVVDYEIRVKIKAHIEITKRNILSKVALIYRKPLSI